MAIPEFRGSTFRKLPDLQAWASQRKEEALEPDLPIIDAHHHLWDDDRGRYGADEFMADVASGHNVVSTVYMQHKAMYRADGPEAMRSVGEVEYVNGIAASSASGRYGPIRLCEGIVGHANLQLGDDVQPVLESLVAAGNGRLKGVRHVAAWDAGAASVVPGAPRHMLLDPQFRRGLARLQALGLSFDTYVYFPQLAELADMLAAFPNARVILNHVGGPLGIPPHLQREEVLATWRVGIAKLAVFPNLSVKLGGLGMLYSGWDFHVREQPPTSEELAAAWRPYIETCIEAFGPARCMFEGNFPVDKQSCGYGLVWNAFKRISGNCSRAEKAALYHDTAARTYRLPRALLAP
jgi:predicted TIM-barrel fold metal-dependent hydrolase